MDTSFRNRLSDSMVRKDITAADLARLIDTTPSTISRYLSGQAAPRADMLSRLSRALNVSPAYLLTGAEIPRWFEAIAPGETICKEPLQHMTVADDSMVPWFECGDIVTVQAVRPGNGDFVAVAEMMTPVIRRFCIVPGGYVLSSTILSRFFLENQYKQMEIIGRIVCLKRNF